MESLFSLSLPSYLHKHRHVYAGCCSVSRRSEFSASSTRSRRSAWVVPRSLWQSLSLSLFLSVHHVVFSSFLSNVFVHRLLSSVCLSSGGNERVRIEASRRALSVVGKRKKERTLRVLSSQSLRNTSPPPLYLFVSLSFSVPLSCVVSFSLSFLLRSLRSSCRAEVNVQAHGVTEITHTLVANPLDCDSPSRLYLASNCSFFFNDARWSTCRSRFRARARTLRPRRRTFEESRKDSLRTFDSSDETWRVAF